jgi:hypothetical protein
MPCRVANPNRTRSISEMARSASMSPCRRSRWRPPPSGLRRVSVAEPPGQSDEELLDRFQRAAFGYFLEQFNPENGLVADTSRAGAPASIAVVGFALSCYPVGVERGWMARADAAARALIALRFFCNLPPHRLAVGARRRSDRAAGMETGEWVFALWLGGL